MMKLSSKELKRRAREILTGRYGLPMMAFVLMELLVLLLNAPFQPSLQQSLNGFQIAVFFIATLFISLLAIVLHSGILYIHLQLSRNKEAQVKDVFRYFNRRPDRFLLSGLLLVCIIAVPALPAAAVTIFLITTGADTLFCLILAAAVWIPTLTFLCILAFSYDPLFFLLIEYPDEKILHLFKKSRRLMRGNKARKFYIACSFLGLSLLSGLSFGIGLLWVSPYINQVNAEFYRDITGETAQEIEQENAPEYNI